MFRIERLAAGGSGVGRLDGGEAVFVAGTAPGELVAAAVSPGGHPRRGRLTQVVEASPDRTPAPCPYVVDCGGCEWMHLSAEAQMREHAACVREALAHAVGEAGLPPVRSHAATAPLRYRTRARLLIEGRRGAVRVGYRAAESHALVAVSRCEVLDPRIGLLLTELPVVFAGVKGRGDVSVACGHGGLPAISMAFQGEIPPRVWAAIDERVAQGIWAGAAIALEAASSPAIFGDPRPVMRGPDGLPLVMAVGGFAQPSDEGASRLALRAAELVFAGSLGKAAPTVLELFSGSGTLSVALARGAAAFTGVEIDREACVAARENLSLRGCVGKIVNADADAFAIPAKVGVVVLDPPRAGARGAMDCIAQASVRTVVYVSCEPSTLARDLGALPADRFKITDIETFEIFPQTPHVETIVRLERRQ